VKKIEKRVLKTINRLSDAKQLEISLTSSFEDLGFDSYLTK